MSYRTMLDEVHRIFEGLPGVRVVIGEPKAVTNPPLLYSRLEGFTREDEGTTVRITYRTLHRLCLLAVDLQAAEEVVIAAVNVLPAALCALPRRGVAHAGDMQITRGEAGFADIGGVRYRVVDFYSEVVEYARLGGDI